MYIHPMEDKGLVRRTRVQAVYLRLKATGFDASLAIGGHVCVLAGIVPFARHYVICGPSSFPPEHTRILRLCDGLREPATSKQRTP